VKLKAVSAKIKQFAPVLIALGIALLFAMSQVIIETGYYEFGPLSKKGLIHMLDLKSLDLKFASRKMQPLPEPKVIIAAIDERGVERFGLWPWSRRVIGDFIRKTSEGGAKVIGFDAVFSDEDKNSSYTTIKRFVNAFDEVGLRPGSPVAAKLEAEVKASETAIADARKDVQALRGPAATAARKALAAQEQTLNRAKSTLADFQKRSLDIYEAMRKEVAAVSPDEALAAAVASSPQTVLGYFNFYNEHELVGVSVAEARKNIDLLAPVGISDVFVEDELDDGAGHVFPVMKPVEGVDMRNMQITPIVGARTNLPKLSKNAKYFGYFNAVPDPDGPLRRVRMFNKFDNKLYPSLSLMAAARYFNTEIRPLNGIIQPGVTLEGIGSLNPASSVPIPTNQQGHLLLNYYKNPPDYFPTYSVADFIDGTLKPEVYKDKVVLFGMTAIGLFDQRATPFSATTPGVYVHAVAVQNMIDGLYLQRWVGLALVEAMVYILIGLLMGLVLPRLPAWAGILVTFALIGALYFVDVTFMFPRGTWMLNVLPAIQCMVTFLGITLYGFLTEGREKRMIRKAFQFYLTKSVVDEVLKDPTKLKLGGDKRVCTVMFSDVRGFTTISERLSPEALVSLLNSYLTPMTDIVYKYDGTLDKYIGDAIMAIFGAPVSYDDHASRACKVGLEMMESLHAMQPGWREQGLPEIDIGIGLNSGPMSAGNMGSAQRFDYTVMGDNVNLASRLEGINKSYGTNIIISESTFEAAKQDIYGREMDLVRVKGKKEPVKIYELLGLGTPAQAHADLMGEFHRAVALYRGQKWDDAVALFETVRTKLKPNDYASGMYIDRCNAMKQKPPAADWDGVYIFTTK